MMANRLRWVASAVFGVVTFLSPQRAEAGWHERLSRDVDHGELRAGLPTVASFPIYHHGSPPVKLDDTITYPGSNWFEQQEALSSFQNSLEPPQSGPPGGSLISLAKLLQSSSSQLRSALLRQFCHSVARLRTRFVGLNSSMQKTENILNNKRNSGSDETESQAATERHISALASKLTGVLGAAEGSGDSGKALTKFLLLPFVRLVHDAEGLMFNIAMEGKVGLMITALNQLAPPIVRGLSYLEAPQSQGAAGVLEPARENCLKRAKELDKALLAAQFDPNGVLRAYPRDFNKYELQREQQLISLEAGPSQQQYIPPVFETGGMPASTEKGKLGRRVKIISIVLACLLFFTVFIATAQPPHPMPIGRSYSRQNAGPHVSDGEEQVQHNRYGPTASHEVRPEMERAYREHGGAQPRTFSQFQQWMHGDKPSFPEASTTSNGGGQGFPLHPTHQHANFGPNSHHTPAYMNGPSFEATHRVTPSAPPLPTDWRTPRSPPPSYSEVMGTSR